MLSVFVYCRLFSLSVAILPNCCKIWSISASRSAFSSSVKIGRKILIVALPIWIVFTRYPFSVILHSWSIFAPPSTLFYATLYLGSLTIFFLSIRRGKKFCRSSFSIYMFICNVFSDYANHPLICKSILFTKNGLRLWNKKIPKKKSQEFLSGIFYSIPFCVFTWHIP